MKSKLALVAFLFFVPSLSAQDPAAPKGMAGWKVEVVAETPKVNYCSVVCCAPDGRVFVAEDPMDMVGPPNQPIDRILCLHPDGKITVYAEKLYAIFGLVYMDGKLYVHHSPKFSVFDDAGTEGKNRVDLIHCTHPKPWGGMNDHIPANFRLGMDGWFYMSAGDKGIYGAEGKDGTKAEILGGGVLRFRPDGTKLEVFSTGTRNHLDVALNAEDEMFTYDNTDDGHGWWTKLTHMVDGGFYGYPYEYKPRRPYTLWMMADYGSGSPTGGLAYNEDALPEEYRGNLFMCEWGKGQLARFVLAREGGSYKIVSRDAFLQKGTKEFRPVGVAVSADGMSIYIADWNYGGWSNRSVKSGRLIKATYQGKSLATPKPAWFLPAALGKQFEATTADLIQGLHHPAQSVRLVAMRRLGEQGLEAMPPLEKLVLDTKAPAFARWSAIWTIDRINEGKQGAVTIMSALKDADPSVRRQAARQLGTRQTVAAASELIALLKDDDRSVRFHAATALGRLGVARAVEPLLNSLDEPDLFTRYAIFTALNRIGKAQPEAWSVIAAGMGSDRTPIREGALFAFRETYTPEAVAALAGFAADAKRSGEARGTALAMVGELSQQRPAWKGEWWGTQPVRSLPPARKVEWAGTKVAFTALEAGLKDSDALVRQGAAQGLVASNNAALAGVLVKHVAWEKDGQVRKTMLQSLSQVRNPDEAYTKAANQLAADLLGTAATAGALPETLAFAANLPTVTPELTQAMLKLSAQDLPPEQLNALLEALSKSKAPEVVSAIVARLQHKDAGVRGNVIRLLTPRAGDEAGKALILALEDKTPALRKEAVIAIGKRKDKSAIPALLTLLKDKDLRFDAITSLAQTPDPRALEAYIDGMGSKNNTQREASIKAVAALKADALPVIEARLARKPALSADVILNLQKIYAKTPDAKTSPLFSVAAKAISIQDFTAAALKENGNIERGRKMFFDVKGLACVKCHRVGKQGGEVGPDLSGIGVKYNKLQLAESVLDPSKQILDGYDMTIIETRAGQVINGIVRSDSGDEVMLVDAEGKKIVLKKSEIETREKSKKSIMPDGLHTGSTITEFADLISYLESLKEKAPVPVPAKTGAVAPKRRLPDSSLFENANYEGTVMKRSGDSTPQRFPGLSPVIVSAFSCGLADSGVLRP